MKKLYQVLAVAMVCCLVIPWFPSRVLAASGNLQVSGGSCNVGQTVSVSVKANAADGDIAAMDVTLSYGLEQYFIEVSAMMASSVASKSLWVSVAYFLNPPSLPRKASSI